MRMKKIYYVETNANDVIVSQDNETKEIRFLNDSNDFDIRPLKDNMNEIEDDSSWDVAETTNIDEFITGEEIEVLAEIEKEL